MKRFYKAVTVDQADDGWRLLLDGRGILTAGKRPQILPSHALAEAMAAEWAEQGDKIDPALFRFRDMADYAIDVIASDPAAAVQAILPYGDTDTLCYRDVQGSALHRRQLALWEPLLTAAEARHDIRFARVSGIVHQAQPDATRSRLEALLAARSPFDLAALQTLASLAASLVIALAAIEPEADGTALWNAANLEEDWQAELWGKDAEAEARRTRRLADFTAAMRFANLAGARSG